MSKCKQCEELKNKINIARTENIKFTLDTKKLIAHYSENLERLKQTLAEIKEIAQGYEDTPNQECKQLCCTEILEKLNQL